MTDFVKKTGGRKWWAFLILTTVFVAFVLLGYIKTEVIIRDLIVLLLGVYGTANISERLARRGEKDKVEKELKSVAETTGP